MVFITSYQLSVFGPVLALVAVVVHGRATVGGFAVLRPQSGAPPRIFQASGGTAQCADVDKDGVGGLARVEITFQDARSGEALVAVIVPRDGDAAVSGRFAATLTLPAMGLSMPTEIGVHYARNVRPG